MTYSKEFNILLTSQRVLHLLLCFHQKSHSPKRVSVNGQRSSHSPKTVRLLLLGTSPEAKPASDAEM